LVETLVYAPHGKRMLEGALHRSNLPQRTDAFDPNGHSEPSACSLRRSFSRCAA
jgi:hypothetical protein